MRKALVLLLLHLLKYVLNKPLVGEDIFDYDLLENYLADATAADGLMTMEELLTRIAEVKESRIPKDKLLDLLEEQEEEENERNGDCDSIGKPPPEPPSPQSKEEAGCVVHYHYHYH